MNIKDFIPNPKNPRTLSRKALTDLANSLEASPWMLKISRILIDEDNVIHRGHQRIKALESLGFTDIPEEWIERVTDLTEEQKEEFLIKDNLHAGEWDDDILQTEWKREELDKWGINTEAWDKGEREKPDDYSHYLSLFFHSDNEYDIPTLINECEQPSRLFIPWGSTRRAQEFEPETVIHFYVDDYRFTAALANPAQIIKTGAKWVIEPNISTGDDMPIPFILYNLFMKRQFSRFLQDFGINVIIDLFTCSKAWKYATLGIPKGYKYYSTRGDSRAQDRMKREYNFAKKNSGGEFTFFIYGGGKPSRQFAQDNKGCIHVPDYLNAKELN